MTPATGSLPITITPALTPLANRVLLESERMITPPIDSLINQLVPLKTVGRASVATNPAVIEAVVLSNSPLLRSDNTSQYQITLGYNQQQYQVTTQTPIPVGATVQLKIAQNNLAIVLAIIDNKTTQSSTTTAGLLQTPVNTSSSPPLPTANTSIEQGARTPANIMNNPLLLNLTEQQQANRQLIAQMVRQTLPQQQSLPSLIPVLQTVLQHQDALPKELSNALKYFMQQMPTAQQLQTPKPLKQAVQNSGIFFESKLAQKIFNAANGNKNSTSATTANMPSGNRPSDNRPGIDPSSKAMAGNSAPITQDTKGLIVRLLNLIQSTQKTSDSQAPAATTNETPPQIPGGAESMQLAAAFRQGADKPAGAPAEHSNQQNLDVLLRQLSHHLLATLARTQLHQMESLGHRQQTTADPQAPVNSWHLELPILHGQHIDSLGLQIEQRETQTGDSKQTKRKKQWLVMLNFDLHHLGKMQVQLAIVERDVSATIWSQHRNTHEQVKKHIADLQRSFEKVGIKVVKVECQLGAAPKKSSPLYHQLVDVRT